MRREEDVFGELSKLCTSPGYIHAIAYVCFRQYGQLHRQVRAKDMLHLFSTKRLIRMRYRHHRPHGKAEVTIGPTGPSTIRRIRRTEDRSKKCTKYSRKHSLYHEGQREAADPRFNLSPPVRYSEPIFYSGESAYSFQYRDLAPRVRSRHEWLISHKGFLSTRDSARHRAIQEQKVIHSGGYPRHPRRAMEMLPGYTFSTQEAHNLIAQRGNRYRCTNAFTLPPQKEP